MTALEDFDMLVGLIPEMRSHKGPCGPEAGCDGGCMDAANVADAISRIRSALPVSDCQNQPSELEQQASRNNRPWPGGGIESFPEGDEEPSPLAERVHKFINEQCVLRCGRPGDVEGLTQFVQARSARQGCAPQRWRRRRPRRRIHRLRF